MDVEKEWNVINSAEKMLMGMQLISDNVDYVIHDKLVSQHKKYKLKNLSLQCQKFVNEFWSHLDADMNAIEEFHAKVKLIEDKLDEHYESLERNEEI